jgi:predicted transcriptional regulator
MNKTVKSTVKNTNSVADLVADLNSIRESLQETYDKNREMINKQEDIIARAKAIIEQHTAEMEKAKFLAKNINMTLK